MVRLPSFCCAALIAMLALNSTGLLAATNENAVSKQDREFVRMAAQTGSAETEAGELAHNNARADAVRELGRRLSQEHAQSNKELESLSARLNIELPKQPDPKHRGDLQALLKARGAEFDRLYVGQTIRDHEMTVKLFESQIKRGGNAELRQYAEKHLPTLKAHLEMAKSVPMR
jgi:putative membrane protein